MTMDSNVSAVEVTNTIEALSKLKGFKLLHMNVRSLPKKIDQIRLMLHDSNLDVITLSETWLTDSVNSKTVNLDNYVMYRQDRNFKLVSKKRGGGLLTYIRKDHAADSEVLEDICRRDGDIEAQWSIMYRPHCKNVVVCNVYRPPTGNLEKAVKYMDEMLKMFELDKVEIFVLGDLNVNYKNKSSQAFKKLNFFTKTNGLSQVIDNTTRNNDKSKSLLDIILTNSIYISKAGTLDHFISDHQPIYVVKKKQRDHRPKVEFKGRSYRNFDRECLERNLKDHNWDQFYKLHDPDEAWDYIINRLTPLLDRMCPIKPFQIKNYRPEWVTNELLEQINDRDYFYLKAKQTGEEDAWNIAKHLRNVTNTNIRQARRDFILTELEENRTDYKRFWKSIRSVIPDNKGNVRQDILLTHENNRLPKKEVAHFINTYFINIGKNDGNNLPNTNTTKACTPDSSESAPSENEWSFTNVHEAEVFKVIKTINVSKSSGIENMSSFVLKEALTILLTQITYLFNLTIKTSRFPKAWKEALVIPIPKTGNLTKVENYRPISLLPLPGKLLEKLIHAQLSEHLETTEFLSENQHGFRKQHSTVHSVAQVTSYINTKMDRGQPTLAAFIDFRKAFDCVQHPVLLGKLASTGIDRKAVKWFESYLTGRKQKVLANNTCSTFQSVTQGVPQGSVLGPLFYIIYANDINKIIKKSKIALYADDTVLYTANPNFGKSVSNIQADMNALGQWCKDNGIGMNVEKIKLVVFGSPTKLKQLPPFEVKVDDLPLNVVTSYKYLGMTLDNHLNFNKHIQNVIWRVSVELKQFRRMRYFLDTRAATLVYKNMILPVIEYGDIFLVGATVENRKKLQTLQNKGLRCALMWEQDTSVTDLHDALKIQKLKVRRDHHLLNYMFDLANSKTGCYLQKRKAVGIRTRSQNKRLLKIGKPNTEKFKNSLAYRGPKKWNALPEQYHHLKSRNLFKNRVKGLVAQKV